MHPEVGALELNCQTLLDPEQSHSLLVYTAVPGSESYEKLQLLSVIGTRGRRTARPVTSARSPGPAARGRRAGRRRAHVVAHRRQQAGEGLDVVARERLEEQVADDLDVAGEHLREQRAPGVGDGDRDAPLVVRGGARA